MKLFKNVWVCATILAAGIVGCNIFNPTENADIASGDAKALTYEGYLHYQKTEYTVAREYFEKAIAADSTHSEAWYGLAKAKLNQQGLNTIELLKYVNVSETTTSNPFDQMPEDVRNRYSNGIDTVLNVLDTLIKRDSLGKSDGVITFNTFSEGYMILTSAKMLLSLRSISDIANTCTIDIKTGKSKCDMAETLANLPNLCETLETMKKTFEGCVRDPASISSIADQFVGSITSWIDKDHRNMLYSTMCQSMSETAKCSEDPFINRHNISILAAEMGYSYLQDIDGDGCLDEEIYDGIDNDGDGEIDENVRDMATVDVDQTAALKRLMGGSKEIYEVMVPKSLHRTEKYKKSDLTHSGDYDNDEAWVFESGTQYLKMAKKMQWYPITGGILTDEILAIKHDIALDTVYSNLRYPLAVRQQYVGGCWFNYTEETFKDWFTRKKD